MNGSMQCDHVCPARDLMHKAAFDMQALHGFQTHGLSCQHFSLAWKQRCLCASASCDNISVSSSGYLQIRLLCACELHAEKWRWWNTTPFLRTPSSALESASRYLAAPCIDLAVSRTGYPAGACRPTGCARVPWTDT